MKLELRQRDSGRTVQLRKGDILEITLAENRTTPYRWRFAQRPSRRVLRLKKSEYVPSPAPPGVVGRGGKHVYRFRAIRRGITSLRLVETHVSDPEDVSGRFRVSIRPG